MEKQAFLAFVFLTILLTACGSSTVDPPIPTIHCEAGMLTVRGAGIELVRASYPDASPPERLLEHSTTPGAWISVEQDWLEFNLYKPVSIVRIATTDYATGERLCPQWAEALP